MISIVHDTVADALYIGVRKGTVSRTVELDNGTLVDVDAANAPVGIEVINPDRAWPLQQFLAAFKLTDDERKILEGLAPWANATQAVGSVSAVMKFELSAA